MKRKILYLLTLAGLMISAGLLSATEQDINDGTFLFCLKHEIEPLQISQSNDVITVDNDQLNSFFQNHQISRIEPWIINATEIDKDGDIYLNRIYRVYLKNSNRSSMEIAKSEITQFPFIHSSEYEHIRKINYDPNDPQLGQQCSIPAVKADLAWDFWDIDVGDIPGDRNVLLASVDTGVEITHPDLEHSIWINQGEVPSSVFNSTDTNNDDFVSATEVLAYLEANNLDTNNDSAINLRDALTSSSPFTNSQDNDGNGFIDDLVGWDLAGWSGADDNDPFPREGMTGASTWSHGTHVAGTLASTTDNSTGVASTAFRASIVAVKVAREYQEDPGITDGYSGITYAAKAGFYSDAFTIINNSWGGGGYSGYEQTVINNAHNTYGAIVVAAAGNGSNSGGEENSAHYPSSYGNVISVCAMGCNGTWGHWATYHSSVDLAAPGENVLSTVIGGGYQIRDGSSMASPNAASCIGLLSAFNPTWDNDQLIERILESADEIIYEINDEDYLQGNLGTGMVDIHKAIGGNIFPYLYYYSHALLNVQGDDDDVLNPGESSQLRITIGNTEGWQSATDLTATLTSDNPGVTIIDGNAVYGDIFPGGIQINISDVFEFELSDAIDLGEVEFNIDLSTTDASGEAYTQSVSFSIIVSLNQDGWPLDMLSEELYNVETSPVVIDSNDDGEMEIYFGDYSGNVYAVNADGEEIVNALFPFNTGDQIWGSPAAADIDNDGNIEIIVTSKSKHLFVLDPVNQTVDLDYYAVQFLMGTPVIANIDDDNDLEIIVGGFSSPAKIFAINADGSDVPGFPFELGEKMIKGLAVADFNDNGKVDIVAGTENYNIYLINDDATIAPGFPYLTGNKIRSAPAIAETESGKIILSGSRDNNFYGLNADGSLRFSVLTGDYVVNSPAFMETESGLAIFFGSLDGNLYGIDVDGNPLAGWPISHSGSITGSPVIADLNGDGMAEIVCGTQSAEIVAYNLDGSTFTYFPINNEFGFAGTPTITDTDGDLDLEILIGSTGNLANIDFKDEGNSDDYWSLFHGNLKRTGYYTSDPVDDCSGCSLGDVNCDGTIDVLDIVRAVYIIMNDPPDADECERIRADINEDGVIDVLDLVMLVNEIMN